MLDLLVVADAARRKTREAVEPKPEAQPKRERPRRHAVRTSSAAALRTLAERLEPSPSA
jgi:hypothetical protein